MIPDGVTSDRVSELVRSDGALTTLAGSEADDATDAVARGGSVVPVDGADDAATTSGDLAAAAGAATGEGERRSSATAAMPDVRAITPMTFRPRTALADRP
ncbi:MAG: hypothetical protein K0S65_2380, partial [Labilithrix sp.]|nr:hypothetical protein [Labilithrix sp.]